MTNAETTSAPDFSNKFTFGAVKSEDLPQISEIVKNIREQRPDLEIAVTFAPGYFHQRSDQMISPTAYLHYNKLPGGPSQLTDSSGPIFTALHALKQENPLSLDAAVAKALENYPI